MEMRVAANNALFAFLFSLMSFLSLLTSLRYVPLPLTIIAGLLGVVVGVVSGFASAKRRLNFLGVVVRARLSTILFFIGGLLILLSLSFIFFSNASIVTLVAATGFLCPMVSAFAASEAVVFLRWERKHRKLIILFSNGRSGKLYASSKTD
jgi:hypothetical protein